MAADSEHTEKNTSMIAMGSQEPVAAATQADAMTGPAPVPRIAASSLARASWV